MGVATAPVSACAPLCKTACRSCNCECHTFLAMPAQLMPCRASNRFVLLLQVNWTVMKEWVAKRVTELLGIEEEVLISMIHNHLIDQVRQPTNQPQCDSDMRCSVWLPVECSHGRLEVACMASCMSTGYKLDNCKHQCPACPVCLVCKTDLESLVWVPVWCCCPSGPLQRTCMWS